MDQVPPPGWTPIAIRGTESGPVVDWCDLRGCSLSGPFFDSSVTGWLARPYPLLFQRTTPLAVLADLQNGPRPAGLVFHVGRCGSTLLAQLLATPPGSVAVSEPGVLRKLLAITAPAGGCPEADRILLLRGLLGALSRPRNAGEERVFVKLAPRETLDLPLYRRAFPDVPWVFLYRDAIEVLVSLDQLTGSDHLPGVVDPALLGLDSQAVQAMAPVEYDARLVAAICEAALANYDPTRTRLVQYSELPSIAWTGLPDHFGFACPDESVERMTERSARRGKDPGAAFVDDTAAKRAAASATIRAAAERFLRDPIARLDALRLGAAPTGT